MIDPLHQQLLGHLLGALDDDEEQYVDARLDRDDDYCREFARWRRRLAPLEALRPDFEPPWGLAQRTCRYVAAHRAMDGCRQARALTRQMSPHPAPPSHISRFGWLDVAAVALLLAVACAMIIPALDGSRFQARLASCQDGMRQFALAVNEYDNAQDVRSSTLHRPATAVAGVFNHHHPGPQSQGAGDCIRDPMGDLYREWPGMWRDGMTDGWRLPLAPANMPLLADAPSVDLPGQEFPSHGGLGQNVLFEDGHAIFVPRAVSSDAPDWLLSTGENSAPSSVSAPIILVSGR